jgi:hypothetical protein
MSCDKTSSALKSNLQINTSSLVRKIYEFEKRQGSSSTPVSFNVTPLSGSDRIPIFSYEDSEHCLEEFRQQVQQECLQQNTFTENGALSYSSSLDPRLDLFFKTVRGIHPQTLTELLEASWTVSPRDTLRTIFYVRDCRGGKGERKIFLESMKWLWNKDRTLFEKNLPCVPYYGCFKDLRKLLVEEHSDHWVKPLPVQDEKAMKQSIVSFWSEVLGKDVESMNQNENITLAAKWVPIQSGLFTREMRLTHKMFRRMVRLLREKLDIVECKMSASEWEKINFERVCSLSHKKYNRAFLRHCPDSYTNYLSNVRMGEQKMNVGQLYPSDIAREFLQSKSITNETLYLAWEQLLLQTREKLSTLNKKFICVVDTSSSMNGRPLEVAVSLGLFLSELYPESKFYRKFITFSAEPSLQEVKGENLYERIQNLSQANWQMNTNLQSVFSLLLDESTAEDHPDVVLILSDMQFDSACPNMLGNNRTNLDWIEQRYKERGLQRPRLVFWNLRENTVDFPSTSQVSDSVLISGYSPHLIQAILDDGEVNPMTLYRKIIDSSRYDLVYCEN